jgi:hypothetical protein
LWDVTEEVRKPQFETLEQSLNFNVGDPDKIKKYCKLVCLNLEVENSNADFY